MIRRFSWTVRWCLAAACALLSLLTTACGSAQPVTASPPQTGPLEFVAEWGMRGDGPGELADPVGLAVDLNNRVYLADRRTGLLQKFEPSGVPSLAYRDLSVRGASAVAVDGGGAIYVGDARDGRVWIHFPDGDLLRNFRIARQSAGDALLGFCVTVDGRIVVPDAGGGRIQVYSPAGRLERAWALPPSEGRPGRPVAAAAGLDEFVYIADAASGRIAKYTNRGAQMTLWDAPADAAEPLRGISVSRDHVFVLRGAKPRLEVWTLEGRHLLTDEFGDRFDDAPAASLYFAVTRDEQVFVLDPARARVLRFRLRLPEP